MAIASHFFHLLMFLVFSPILAVAQSECKFVEVIAGGNPGSLESSPSGKFAIGFRPLNPSTNNDDGFLLAIWFNKIPEQTIVWFWSDSVLKGTKIQLRKEGLVLVYPQGQEKTIADTGNQTPTCAKMDDSGNFVLKDKDSRIVWESFNFPTDTMLPGQTIRMGGNLTSRVSSNDTADGKFQLRMQKDGNLVLYTISLPTEDVNGPYWASGTQRPNPDSEFVFNQAGYMYITEGNKSIYNVTKKDLELTRDVYQMARIDADGVFRHYRHTTANYVADSTGCSSAWSVLQTIPDNVCTITGNLGSGACGFNSYCQNVDGWPKCYCPDRFSPVDSVDITGKGCRPNFQMPSCQPGGWETNPDMVEFLELNHTNWPLSDYEIQRSDAMDLNMCKDMCRKDCFCAAAIYNMNNSCFKKKFPLSNGNRQGDLISMALIKVPKNNETDISKGKDLSTVVLIISILLGSSVFINILLLATISVAVMFVYRKNLMNLLSPANVHGVRRYTYEELVEATGSFKQEIGRGSFGTVYKGVLVSVPKRYIAVKKLDREEKEGEKEFVTEVSTIGQTHHKNLVNLLGYCDQGSHRLLVLEYMSNGSLASLLFGLSRPHWNQRMQIAIGIARGLTYLHEECSTQIIHCDVKPQNILLDECLVPKISDFGLAKVLLSKQSRAARTHLRGTVGYFAPEWFRKASITVKVDVYSFGVMLLEMICCTSSVAFAIGDREEEALVDWVYDCYSRRKLDRVVENDEEARNDMKGVERGVMVGIWCIQEDPSLRPSMRRVTHMLEGVAEVSVPPRPSVFTSSSS